MKMLLRALIGTIRKNVSVEVRTRTVDFTVHIEVTVYVLDRAIYRRVWQNVAGPKLPHNSPFSAAWPAGMESPEFILDNEEPKA